MVRGVERTQSGGSWMQWDMVKSLKISRKNLLSCPRRRLRHPSPAALHGWLQRWRREQEGGGRRSGREDEQGYDGEICPRGDGGRINMGKWHCVEIAMIFIPGHNLVPAWVLADPRQEQDLVHTHLQVWGQSEKKNQIITEKL